jgi:hypothetical protein
MKRTATLLNVNSHIRLGLLGADLAGFRCAGFGGPASLPTPDADPLITEPMPRYITI